MQVVKTSYFFKLIFIKCRDSANKGHFILHRISESFIFFIAILLIIKIKVGMLSFFSRHSFAYAKPNPFQRVASQVQAAGKLLTYYNIRSLNDPRLEKLPFSIRILLESAVRNCD